MKKLLLSLPVLAVLAVVMSCRFTSSNQRLADVDTLLVSRPDSALAQLRVMADTMATASRADRMYYQLLLADAQNKCYVDFTTDSMMKQVAAYYDRHGTTLDRIRAHYLLGCTYRDLGEAPQALQCYQDAVELADTTNHDHLRLLLKVYGQMAELYDDQNLPQDEINCGLATQRYALMLGDTLLFIRCLDLMVKPYFLLGDTTRMVETEVEAHRLYLLHHAPDKAAGVRVFLMDMYVNQGRLAEVHQLMDEFERDSGLFDEDGRIEKGREYYYCIKGRYYLKQHQIDSAAYYFRRLQREGRSLNDTIGFCKGLMNLYQRLGVADSMAKYSRLYAKALDRQSYERQTETVHRMSQLYNYQRFQQQAATERQTVDRVRFWLLVVLLAVVVAVVAIVVLVRHWLHEKQLKQQAYEEYQANIDALEKQAAEVQRLKQHEKEYQDLIVERGQKIDELEQKIADYQHLQNPLNAEITENPVYVAFKTHALCGEMPSAAEWQQLLQLVELHLPAFHQFLKQWEPHLTDKEYRLCVLVRLHVAPSSIAAMLQVSAPYINKLRIKLLSLLFGSEGKAAEFNLRIQRMR